MKKKVIRFSHNDIKENPRIRIIKIYGFHLLFLILAVNYIVVRRIQLKLYAQSCITKAAVENDSRCLYTYFGNIYQKGTKNKPHRGHVCGSDVTTVMPSNHISSAAEYLDPSLKGTLCSNAATPTPTPIPAPEATPTPTDRPNTPTPTQNTGGTSVKTPTPTSKPTIIATPTPTPQPMVMSPNRNGFGKYIPGKAPVQEPSTSVDVATAAMPVYVQNIAAAVPTEKVNIVVLWSEILVAISFVLLIIVSVVGVVRKIWIVRPRGR